MINLNDFDSSLLKIDKKSYLDVNIYYIGYITVKKFDDYENIHIVSPLYLIIHSATGHFNKKKQWWIFNYWFDRQIWRSLV